VLPPKKKLLGLDDAVMLGLLVKLLSPLPLTLTLAVAVFVELPEIGTLLPEIVVEGVVVPAALEADTVEVPEAESKFTVDPETVAEGEALLPEALEAEMVEEPELEAESKFAVDPETVVEGETEEPREGVAELEALLPELDAGEVGEIEVTLLFD